MPLLKSIYGVGFIPFATMRLGANTLFKGFSKCQVSSLKAQWCLENSVHQKQFYNIKRRFSFHWYGNHVMEHPSWKYSVSILTLCKACIDNFQKKMYLSQSTDRCMSNSMTSGLVFCFHISMQVEYKDVQILRDLNMYMEKQTFISLLNIICSLNKPVI